MPSGMAARAPIINDPLNPDSSGRGGAHHAFGDLDRAHSQEVQTLVSPLAMKSSSPSSMPLPGRRGSASLGSDLSISSTHEPYSLTLKNLARFSAAGGVGNDCASSGSTSGFVRLGVPHCSQDTSVDADAASFFANASMTELCRVRRRSRKRADSLPFVGATADSLPLSPVDGGSSDPAVTAADNNSPAISDDPSHFSAPSLAAGGARRDSANSNLSVDDNGRGNAEGGRHFATCTGHGSGRRRRSSDVYVHRLCAMSRGNVLDLPPPVVAVVDTSPALSPLAATSPVSESLSLLPTAIPSQQHARPPTEGSPLAATATADEASPRSGVPAPIVAGSESPPSQELEPGDAFAATNPPSRLPSTLRPAGCPSADTLERIAAMVKASSECLPSFNGPNSMPTQQRGGPHQPRRGRGSGGGGGGAAGGGAHMPPGAESAASPGLSLCPPGFAIDMHDATANETFSVLSEMIVPTEGLVQYCAALRLCAERRSGIGGAGVSEGDGEEQDEVAASLPPPPPPQRCKRFLEGVCHHGAACGAIHTISMPKTSIHVNRSKVAASLQQFVAEFDTLPPGVRIFVYPSNSTATWQEIQSGNILKTDGALNAFGVLRTSQEQALASGDELALHINRTPLRPRHCAHFQSKRVCFLGSSCNFIHSLVPAVDTTRTPPPPPPPPPPPQPSQQFHPPSVAAPGPSDNQRPMWHQQQRSRGGAAHRGQPPPPPPPLSQQQQQHLMAPHYRFGAEPSGSLMPGVPTPLPTPGVPPVVFGVPQVMPMHLAQPGHATMLQQQQGLVGGSVTAPHHHHHHHQRQDRFHYQQHHHQPQRSYIYSQGAPHNVPGHVQFDQFGAPVVAHLSNAYH